MKCCDIFHGYVACNTENMNTDVKTIEKWKNKQK